MRPVIIIPPELVAGGIFVLCIVAYLYAQFRMYEVRQEHEENQHNAAQLPAEPTPEKEPRRKHKEPATLKRVPARE